MKGLAEQTARLGMGPEQARLTLQDLHCVGFSLILCCGAEVLPPCPNITDIGPV